MPRNSSLPPELNGFVFSVEQARSLGVSRQRLRGRDLAPIFRGVYGPSGSSYDPALAFALRLHEGHVLSHLTAARLHRLILPRRFTEVDGVHVCAIKPERAPRHPGVVGHHADAGNLRTTTVDGIPVVTAADAWCQIASMLSLRELVIAGDGLVCRQNPTIDIGELRSAVERWTGRRGAKKIREAFAFVRAGTDSPQETLLRLMIVDAGLPEPLVNHVITDSLGRFLALGDLVYPEWRILIEYDGGHHFASEEQGHHDVDRLELVMAEGWRVIRVHRRHMGSRTCARIPAIRSALRAAGWSP